MPMAVSVPRAKGRSAESIERRAEYSASWRARNPEYNRRWNRAHPRTRALTVSRSSVLKQDIAQQACLAALSHKAADDAEAYGARERHWIYLSAVPIVSYDESQDGEGIAL